MTFSDLDPERREPLTFIVTAFDAQGVVLANITRQVRLGKPCTLTHTHTHTHIAHCPLRVNLILSYCQNLPQLIGVCVCVTSPPLSGIDCSVVFVNAGEDDAVIIDPFGFVRVEWEEVGPVDFTDCRLEINGVRGDYELCKCLFVVLNHMMLM